ncbi:RING finger protein 151-like [Lytechinus variegatus]|uniref:RING finger protein 151-like n=1 Tax=Lytechinus variegatus TaxID=7654 RepID=UPI001BB16A98|nr:RING finger protein 151-like [Lytechinus variegatus]
MDTFGVVFEADEQFIRVTFCSSNEGDWAWSWRDSDDTHRLVDVPPYDTNGISRQSTYFSSPTFSSESTVKTGSIPHQPSDSHLASPGFIGPDLAMGYDQDRFLGPIKDGLMCSICKDVLEEPLQAPCEHAFCATCIHGWLVHERTCPEDRQNLEECDLRPLFRYMRNDLNKLRLRCVNADSGCSEVCSLEVLSRHESECSFGTAECPNRARGCEEILERRLLDSHLANCRYRSSKCPNGCGLTILSSELESHNCVSELRTELELLRSEMICKQEDLRHEMQLRLDSQRAHMVEKVGTMHQTMDQLRGDITSLQHELRVMNALETQRRQHMEALELERKELKELLKSINEGETARSTCRVCKKTEMVTAL